MTALEPLQSPKLPVYNDGRRSSSRYTVSPSEFVVVTHLVVALESAPSEGFDKVRMERAAKKTE